MKKSKLRQIIREEIQKLNEYSSNIIQLHRATTQKEFDKLKKDIEKNSNWSSSDVDYMLKKYRKDINYKGPNLYIEPSKPKKVSWSDRTYKKWIKDMASEGGAQHSFDMAQNAKHEPGLIDYIKKQIKRTYGDETSLERIQWDIEAHI